MLSRSWSRIIIVLRYMGLVAALGPVLLQADSLGIVTGLVISAALLFLTYYLTKTKLACPKCGRDHYEASWNGKAQGRCRHCGHPFRFDDER